MSDQLEGQQQEQAIQRYHSQADELDQWLDNARSSITCILEPQEETDMEEQLSECQVGAPPTALSLKLRRAHISFTV